MQKRNIFLTGATGLIGSHLARGLLKKGYLIYCLSRNKGKSNYKDRIYSTIKQSFSNTKEFETYKKNINILEGDLTIKNLGLNKEEVSDLLAVDFDLVIHSAACTDLNGGMSTFKENNVKGTKNLLDLFKDKELQFCYLSTIFVAGNYKYKFSEDQLFVNQKFNNNYEKSKFESEVLINNYKGKYISFSIFRLSMVVGDSIRGHTTNFRLIYQPLKLLTKEILNVIPADANCSLNLINVDSAVKAITILIENQKNYRETFHILSPNNYLLGNLFDDATDYFSFIRPKLIPKDRIQFDKFTTVQKNLIMPFVPYLNSKVRIDSKKTFRRLNKLGFNIPKFDKEKLIRVFDYCREVNFSSRKDNI